MPVRVITSPELVLHRGEKQYSEVYVIPRVPNVVYTASLNGAPSSTDMVGQITYDGGVGTLANVLVDMTVRVGSTAGARDLGICRIRKTPTSTIFYVGELSHIDWIDNCFLTVVDDYDVLPRHLKIVNGNFKIDYDQAYTDQHTNFEPVVNMGGHVVLEWSGSPVSLVRTALPSWVFGSTISTYLWSAPGSSLITGSTTATPTITWSAVGHHVIYCQVTAANGKTFTGVRYVFVVDVDSIAAQLHSVRVTENFSDGASFEITMSENAALDDFPERAFVILWSRDYYDGHIETIGYNLGEENIIACGRISDEDVSYNAEFGTVQISVKGWKYWLEKIGTFPTGLERAINTPTLWISMPLLNVDRAIFHLLRYRSTVTRICDFYPSDDVRYAEELASVNSNLWSQIEEIAKTSIFADLVFDRFGSAYLRVEPQLVPESARSAWVVVQDITSDDWQEEMNFEWNSYTETAQMLSSGVAVSQFGSALAYFSMSPGHIPFPYGDMESLEKLLLASQAQANSFAGLLMGWRNRLFDDLSVSFVGNNRMFSVAQYNRANIVINASDNPRGVAYNGFLCPRSIEYLWDQESGHSHTVVNFQDESVEMLSVDGDVPFESGVEDGDGFHLPPLPAIQIPNFPIILLPPTDVNLNAPKIVVISSSQGVFYSTDFNTSNPTWMAMNSGLAVEELADIFNIVVTPVGAIYVHLYSAGKIMRAGAVGGTFTELASATQFVYGIHSICAHPLSSDTVLIAGMGTWPTIAGKVRLANNGVLGSPQGDVQLRTSMGASVFHNDKWFVIGSHYGFFLTPWICRYSLGGALQYSGSINTAVGQDVALRFAQPLASSIFQWDASGAGGFNIITADGVTATRSTVFTPRKNVQGFSFSPTGTHGMGAAESVLNIPYKTTDGGASFQIMTGTIPVGLDVWESCRDNNRWIFGGGTTLRMTFDQGSTFIDKNGNLGYIAPFIDITGIRFISDG